MAQLSAILCTDHETELGEAFRANSGAKKPAVIADVWDNPVRLLSLHTGLHKLPPSLCKKLLVGIRLDPIHAPRAVDS